VLYKKPTFGRVWKLIDYEHASVMFRGVRLVSLESQSLLQHTNLPYSKDLITFSNSAIPIIEEYLPSPDVLKSTILSMLRGWATCSIAVDSSSERELQKLETVACHGLDQKSCDLKVFQPLPKDAICNNAFPYLQQQHFNTFGYNLKKREVLKKQDVFIYNFPIKIIN